MKHGAITAIVTSLITSSLFSLGTVSAQEISVGSMLIPGLFTKAKDGVYDQAMASAATQSGVTINNTVLPPARAIAQFEAGQVDCLAPADVDFFNLAFATVQSKPFNLGKIYIYTKAGSTPLQSLSELQGKKVGIRNGMPYGNEFDSMGLNATGAGTIESNIKKVQAGRLDAFLGYVPDAWTAFEALGMDPLPHAEKPIAIHEDSILCRDTPATRSAINALDGALDEMKASGALKAIMGSGYTMD